MTAPARPLPLRPQWQAIPQALRDVPAWVAWRYEWRADKQGAGKWTKPPRRAVGDGYAATNNPDTWADFETARKAADHADGVGLVLTADLVGVDLDHVIGADGVIEPWAADVIERFRGAYIERSPGGDGLRIFCRGIARHSGKGGPGNRCELYGEGSPRYLTVTGHRMGEGEVIEAQAALDWLHARHFVKAAAPAPQAVAGALSDDEVMRRAGAATNGPKFARLFAGQGGEDASASASAVLGILAFCTQDAAQVDPLFRRSGLMRPKWDEQRGATSYGERTIAAVLDMGGERFGSSEPKSEAKSRGAPTDPPRPLPAELLPVDPFPLDALPDAFRPWVADVTERMQCPADFVAVPLIVAAASLAARHVALRPKLRDDWSEPGNLWALIVGRPGVMKSPAMRAALEPLHRLESLATEAFNAEAGRHRIAELAHKLRGAAAADEAKKALRGNRTADVSALLADDDLPIMPTRRRYIVNGPTWEKLHALLSENPGGLLMERDEMRGWFLDMGREEQAEARSFFVNAWSGGDFTVDRIGRGTVTAADMRVSIIGAIQPGPLGHIMRGARSGGGDDGLIERFLIAWPDDANEWRDVDRFPDGPARERVRQVFDRLDTLTADELGAERRTNADGEPYGLPFLRLADDAREAFNDWRAGLERQMHRGDAEATEAALSKFRHHVPALALALHLADGGVGAVAEMAMLRALALADYFEGHARRLHASGQRASVKAARLILDKARSGALPDPFTVRDAHRPRWSGLTENEIVADAVDLLTAHGWLTEATLETGGRRTAVYSLTEGARRG